MKQTELNELLDDVQYHADKQSLDVNVKLCFNAFELQSKHKLDNYKMIDIDYYDYVKEETQTKYISYVWDVIENKIKYDLK